MERHGQLYVGKYQHIYGKKKTITVLYKYFFGITEIVSVD